MTGPTPACQPPPAADTPAPPRFRFPHALIEIGCRYALAAVFLRAGAMKLAALDGFAAGFTVHLRIKPTLAIPLAAFIPWLELTCAFCLVLGTAKREAAAILGVLLIVFTAYASLGARRVGLRLQRVSTSVADRTVALVARRAQRGAAGVRRSCCLEKRRGTGW